MTFLSSLINLFDLHLTQYASMPKQEVSKIKDAVYKMIVRMLGCTYTSIRVRRYKFSLDLTYFCKFSRYYSNLVINNKILLLLIWMICICELTTCIKNNRKILSKKCYSNTSTQVYYLYCQDILRNGQPTHPDIHILLVIAIVQCKFIALTRSNNFSYYFFFAPFSLRLALVVTSKV